MSPCRHVALSPCRPAGKLSRQSALTNPPTRAPHPPTHTHTHPDRNQVNSQSLSSPASPPPCCPSASLTTTDGREGSFSRIHRPTSSTTTTTASELLLAPVSAIKYYSRTLQRPETRSSPPPTAAAPSSLHFSWSNPFKFPRPFWALSTPEHAHVSR